MMSHPQASSLQGFQLSPIYCLYLTLFITAHDSSGLCWKHLQTEQHCTCKPKPTSREARFGWCSCAGFGLCRAQAGWTPIHLHRQTSFPCPVTSSCCTAEPALTCGQLFFQEQKSWKALRVLPTGLLCKSPWRNPPSLGAARQEPRSETRLGCPTAQSPRAWAVEEKPQTSGSWIPRVKLMIFMELMRIHLRLHLCGKTASHPGLALYSP